MSSFKPTDFIQVEHSRLLDSGEPALFWRNALYVGEQYGRPIVIYTDGSKQVLPGGIRIRRAELDKDGGG